VTAFVNEPLLELRRAPVRAGLHEALAALDARGPVEVPVLVGGQRGAGVPFERRDPSAPDRTVSVARAADDGDVRAAIQAAAAAQPGWAARPAAERAQVLHRAAGGLRARRAELAALAVREAGKPWPEADADVCEAIDFLRFYADRALELEAGAPLVQPPGERNRLRYVPRGVVAVIAPWNFPLAIPCGLAAGPLAAGNAVVLKPAEQTPACAAALVRELHAAGVPPGVLALLPGGDAPGRALVADPGVHAIAFTGSQAAGLAILEAAAKPVPGQRHVKRVVAEMGGKNCVLVAADADLDDAVPAILRSAFGFAGQKCSAASRVLVCEPVADALAARLAGAVATLRVGPAEDLATDVPPVVDAAARDRLLGELETGRAQAAAVHTTGGHPSDGWYVPPTLLVGLPADSELLARELFGPVLALETVGDLDEAVERVAALPYALTGGLFSRSPATVERVAAALPVGNLYVNREITGAMVGRQPFGGGRLSGTGPKAGGPDFVREFVEARCVTENTVRHGLVV
jgi:RHH-type proline utilization regulon transcriptional repressor/proline dehydrogenase/delta 1-pyrroline-5-carboxylate dehydrogenase